MSKSIKTSTNIWTAHWPYELRKKQQFSLDRAKRDTWYELWQWRKGWRGKIKWSQVPSGRYPDGGAMYKRGDLLWAKRIAKEFNLEVPR